MNPFRTLLLSDLRGVVRLATRATTGVADLAESVHQTVWSTIGVAPVSPGRTGGVTGLVYRGVRGVANGVGGMSEGLLDMIDSALVTSAKARTGKRSSLAEVPSRGLDATPESRTREALLAVLNGVLGDRLAAQENPLATRMTLRCRGQVLGQDAAPVAAPVSGNVLLLVHGLCMNDLQWQLQDGGSFAGHGALLEQTLGMTPVYVRYNSGLAVARNGAELSAQIEQMLAHWPVEIEQLCIVGHSMGGLVARSALHAAQCAGARWPSRLRKMVFLGTPHHGAPLERAGSWVDRLLGSTPFTAPFARLGELRSAGITDLRFGRVLDENGDADRRPGDASIGAGRRASQGPGALLPLPAGVQCYTIAAALAASRSALSDHVTGDGLVPIRSALGEHDDPQRRLHFAAAHQHISWRTGHVELLHRPEIGERLVRWLAS